jgi:hypothetical protein
MGGRVGGPYAQTLEIGGSNASFNNLIFLKLLLFWLELKDEPLAIIRLVPWANREDTGSLNLVSTANRQLQVSFSEPAPSLPDMKFNIASMPVCSTFTSSGAGEDASSAP